VGGWHQSLGEFERLLAKAAEDVHAEDLRHNAKAIQWIGIAASIQVRR
jgi:hypothetical protein